MKAQLRRSVLPGLSVLSVLLLFLSVFPGRVQAESSSTVIYETLLVGESRCTIEILRDPSIVVCSQSLFQIAAAFECLEGTNPVNEPQWFLDGEPIGIGTEISLDLELGNFLLEVSCGSCQDQIAIEAVDCVSQPRLDVAYANDETEATTGIFVQKNIAPVSSLSFAKLRFLMRPFSLSIDESVESGTISISVSGDPALELFTLDGTPVLLPIEFDVADLPQDFLVNGSEFGTATIAATYSVAARGVDPFVDEVRVQVGSGPGLSGLSISEYPYFHFVDTFNEDGAIRTALDPTRHPEREGWPYDVYVVPHKSPLAWSADNSLTDVTGQVETKSVIAGSVNDNITQAWASGLDAGSLVSRDYDIVYDFGQDGTLDPGDLIDGFSEVGAGCYVVKDLSLSGPYSVERHDYSGGTWTTQRVYYPTNVASLGEVPLVTIGHGNGHNYTWYNYLGDHLASHGYVVMCYRNNTGPGIESASTTTLTNMDYFLANLPTIDGGVLDGHIATERIGWVGHSRGGEGIVRAYDRLYDGAWNPQGYSVADVRVLGSIAPTVYLLAAESDPHDQNYYLIVGGADGDVTGRPDLEGDQYFRIPDRSLGTSLTTYVHGATHNDFNCCGFDDGIGPNQIGRAEAQVVAKSFFLALMQNYLSENSATREYFTRMYDDLTPSGIAANVEIASTYRVVDGAEDFVIDDFQTQSSLNTSSSGGTVSATVANAYEGNSEDNNTSYSWIPSDPMNGMTMYHGDGDFARSLIFDHPPGATRSLEFEVIPAFADVRGHRYLSLRACQATRHPETVALDDAHSFSVTLRDADGTRSTVPFGSWGKLTDLYPRSGSGSGSGWVSEMNTVRIALSAFETDGSGIDLSRIVAVELEFGSDHGSDRGRIGLDDLQFVK